MIRRRAFGSTGVELPEIGFGVWAPGSDGREPSPGAVDDVTSVGAVTRACELGVELFDTGLADGRSQRLLAKALGQEGTVLTRAGFDVAGRDRSDGPHLSNLRGALEGSLARLGRDQVDLFQLHNPSLETIRNPDTAVVLGALRDEGLTRWTGLSVQRLEEALAVLDLEGVDAVQLPVSILRQDLLSAVAELAAAGIAVVAREPLANGLLAATDAPLRPVDLRGTIAPDVRALLTDAAERAREALAAFGVQDPVGGARSFVLAHEVSVVLPRASTPEQVEQDLRSPYEVGRLPADCLEALYDLGDELHG